MRRSLTAIQNVPRGRPGYSLVQMLVTISVAGILAGIGITTIGTLLRTQSRLQEHVVQVRLRSRLSRVFRDDVHAARSAQWDETTSTLTLSGLSSQVTYRTEGEFLLRQEFTEKTAKGHETFWLGTLQAAYSLEPPDGSREVQLSLRSLPGKGRSGPPGEYVIRARLGRDLRFLAGGAK